MEEWKEIPGYEGIYEASTLGRIRTIEGKTTSNARYHVRVWKQRVLKVKTKQRARSSKFAERVSLWKDGVERTCLVARLVAMTWRDGYKEGLTVNHIDGNPLNNRIENLEWISLGENILHGYQTGQYSSAKPCILVNSKGEKKAFYSLSAASQSIGRSSGYISNQLKKGKAILSVNGEAYGVV